MNESDKWTRIKARNLVRLTQLLPRRLRWKWQRVEKNGRTKLQLVSPRGVIWSFKLAGGAWMRRQNNPNETHNKP